jgi:GT2 family glycosyltransferase
MKKTVSVIIINFNSATYTIACVQSILKYTDKNFAYEIIIIDNNSAITDYHSLQSSLPDYSHIKLYRSKINLGFSGGNMLGISYANAQYYYLLNNDAELLNDNLSILSAFMKTHTNAALCTGQMYNTDKSFHHSFNYFPTPALKYLGVGFLRLFNPAKFPSKKTKYTEPIKVDLVTGAAMFIDAIKLAEIGGMDTNYFLYCEEEDLAKQLSYKHYDTFLVPNAEFIHHMGKSTKRSLAIEKESYISILYYHKKHANQWSQFLMKWFYIFKNVKKGFKDKNYFSLAAFIFRNPDFSDSIKHQQVRSEI